MNGWRTNDDYEKSMIDFANSNPDGFTQVKDQIRVLYPTPTIWNSHCIATFNEKGNAFYKAFEDADIQKIRRRTNAYLMCLSI